ncbi:hypothetical protein [Paramaledivibacter caminithermalis]|uniref:hypothetical protein n=1 Tax=Paramaledivibacter caminithermalis TaxID=191027 RepID=UPI000932BF6F|nr:hypothetical protein [Paramaledivibacter caminithermalis]
MPDYIVIKLIEMLENYKMRPEDISQKLNITNIETASLLNRLLEKQYICKEEVRTSELYIENYYYVNLDKIDEIHDEILKMKSNEKIQYIAGETTRIVDIILSETIDKPGTKMQLSTINISEEEHTELLEKIKDLCEFIKKCGKTGKGKKYSMSLFFTERPDLGFYE